MMTQVEESAAGLIRRPVPDPAKGGSGPRPALIISAPVPVVRAPKHKKFKAFGAQLQASFRLGQ
jgi:hypothetical protein